MVSDNMKNLTAVGSLASFGRWPVALFPSGSGFGRRQGLPKTFIRRAAARGLDKAQNDTQLSLVRLLGTVVGKA